MKGILAVNHFLSSDKFNELHKHLISSAKKTNIDLKLFTNLELATVNNIEADFVLFWDKDIILAKRLELMGLPVFNSSSAIEKCDDKAKTYLELLGKVSQPETYIAPKAYFKADMSEFVDNAIAKLGLPLVFKECFGSFGEQVHLCTSRDEILSLISDRPFLLQKFIEESCGSDKRLEVVGGKIVGAVRRKNKNDFRSNVTNGGKMTKYTPSDDDIKTALKACEILGLDFGGVDILENGMICEVNSNAHIINIMNTIGTDIAPLIFEHISEKINERNTDIHTARGKEKYFCN